MVTSVRSQFPSNPEYDQARVKANVSLLVSVVAVLAASVFVVLAVALSGPVVPFLAVAAIGAGLVLVTALGFCFYCEWQKRAAKDRSEAIS